MASSSYINARQDYSRGSITVSATVNLKEGNAVDVVLNEGEIQGGSQFWGQIIIAIESDDDAAINSSDNDVPLVKRNGSVN